MKDTSSEGYTEVFAWGTDSSGQMGFSKDQTGKTHKIPKFCSFNVIIHQIACGDEHSAFIASNGYIYTMGSNADGKLGLSTRELSYAPTPSLVDSLADFQAVRVSCGRSHTSVILDNGDLYAWGSNSDGQLGLGNYKSHSIPQRVKLTSQSTTRFIDVDCGSRHTVALTTNGEVYTMGSGEFGQLGTGYLQNEVLPKKLDLYGKVEKISAGESHTLVLTENGKIYASGSNSTGQLGIGSRKSSLVFVKVSTTENLKFKKVAAGTFSAAFCIKGELYLWGTGAFGEYLTPKKIGAFKHPLKRLSVGTNFGCCIDSKGNVYSWGSNTHGELGLGSFDPKSIPQQVLSLQGKRITAVTCGRNFVLALGNTISDSHSSVEKSRDSAVAYETESRRNFEKEISAKRAERSVNNSLLNISSQTGGKQYKERNSEFEKSLNEDQKGSIDARERLSAIVSQNQQSSKKPSANRPKSFLPKNQRPTVNSSEMSPNRQMIKKTATRGTQKASIQRENNFDRQNRHGSSSKKSPQPVSKASQDRSAKKYRSSTNEKHVARSNDTSPNKSYSRERSPADNLRNKSINQDSLIEEVQFSKNLQTASFEDLHSSDVYRKSGVKDSLDSKPDWRNNRISNERASSGNSKARFSQQSANHNPKRESQSNYQPRIENLQYNSIRSDGQYQDSRQEIRLKTYEEAIRENNKEILALHDTITGLKRQLNESESKIRTLMLQEKFQGSKSMDGTGESWKDLQQELSLAMREKTKLEKLLEQEKHHNQTVMTLLEEKDNKIKDLENEVFNLNNEKLRFESEESEIEKERDYFRKKLDEFTDKFDKQQLELNALLNQKDQHLERIISDKKNLEQRLEDANEEINKMAAGYEHQKKVLAELQKAREELQKANTKLLSENEARNLTKVKLDNAVSSLNDKLEEQTRRFNQMIEKKEQVIQRQKQDLDLQVAENEVVKAENQNLIQQIEEKISQIRVLRSHVESLENAFHQKNNEAHHKRSRLSGFGGNDSYSVLERSIIRTPPSNKKLNTRSDEKRLTDEFGNSKGFRETNNGKKSIKNSGSGDFFDQTKSSVSPNRLDSRFSYSPDKSPVGGRSRDARSKSHVSPIRKTAPSQSYKQDRLFDLRPSNEDKRSPQKFVGSGHFKREEGAPIKRSNSASKDSVIKKALPANNNFANFQLNEHENREIRGAKDAYARLPLASKDSNEHNSALTAKFQEEYVQSNKQLPVPKTLETIDVLSSQRKILGDEFIERPKQIGRQFGDNKENTSSSPTRNKQESTEKADLGFLKSRLQDLQKNKNALEQRMQEFEKKLKEGKRK